MISRDYLFNYVFASLVFITVWALWSLGESRLDVYISLYTLAYVTTKAVMRPRRLGFDWLIAVLLVAFFTSVGLRIYRILVTGG